MIKQLSPLMKFVSGLFICVLTPTPSLAQNKSEGDDDIQLNMDAVKMIQFDFNPSDKPDSKPRKAPLNKTWMEFKTDIGIPRSLLDTTTVRKPKNFIRLLPYSIWTRFGDDPVYDVLVFKREKKLEMTFHLGSTVYQEEYGRTIKPSAGKMYNSISSPLGSGAAIQGLDINKFLTENLTRRGRMLRRNRKNANTWKIYQEYSPTKEDSLKLPTFYKRVTLPIVFHQDTTAERTDSLPIKTQPKESSKAKENADNTSWLQYIQKKVEADSIQRQQAPHKKQLRENVYDVDRQIRRLKELQN